MLQSNVFKRAQLACMSKLFADALGIPAPKTRSLSCIDALASFQAFSTNAAFQASNLRDGGASKRQRLHDGAYKLGHALRRIPLIDSADPADVLTALYANIDIQLQVEPDGIFRMPRCSFSTCYSPVECAFMSAFDQGIIEAFCGDGTLEFSKRLTQGDPCCCAKLTREEQQ